MYWIEWIWILCFVSVHVINPQNIPPSGPLLDRITWRAYLSRNVYGWYVNIPATKALPDRLSKRLYHLAFGLPNYAYANCPNSQTECRFLEHCARREYLNSFDVFLANACPIGADYIGVCCPKMQSAKPVSSSDGTINTFCKLRECGVACHKPLQHRILGGEAATSREWPWMATLLRDETRFCGGVLITDRHVLTSAHCVYSFGPSDIHVRLGEYDFQVESSTERDYSVESFAIHEQYDRKKLRNDIALLKLSQKVLVTPDIKPVCLADQTLQFDEQDAYVTGWGMKSPTFTSTDVLLEVQLPIRTQTYCKNIYSAFRINVTESQLCAGGIVGKDTCQGDSGGPLMIQNAKSGRWHVVGILSFGKGCGEQDRPGVYTRISSFESWIKAKAFEL